MNILLLTLLIINLAIDIYIIFDLEKIITKNKKYNEKYKKLI